MFKKFLICCLALATVVGISMATIMYKDYTSVNAEGVVIDLELSGVDNTYLQNDVLEGLTKDVTVKYPDSNGEAFTATDGTIFYPNNVSYAITDGGKYVLSEIGKYVIRYYHNSDDANFVAEKHFVVSNNYFDIVGKGGSLVLPDENNPLQYQNKNGSNTDGLILNLEQSNKFVYNKTVNIYDVNNAGNFDGLKEIISINPRTVFLDDINNTPDDTADDKWAYNAQFAYVRITDCYDATNYIDIRILKSTTYGGWVMINAGTAKIPFTCMFPTDKPIGTSNVEGKAIKYNNSNYFMYVNRDDLGISGFGYGNSGGPLTIKYNPNNGCIYVQSSYSNGNKLILDLDSTEVHGENAFKGFTTGEVSISVYNDLYYEKVSPVEVYSIDGVAGATLKSYVENNAVYSDDIAPTLNLDAYLTTTDGFYAGINEKIYIPDANAKDVHLKGDVEVSVLYGLDDEGNYKSATLYSDAKGKYFITKNESEHIIRYTAEDQFGNKTIKDLKVTVFPAIEDRSIALGSIDNPRADFIDSEKISDAEFFSGEVMTLKPVEFFTLNKDLSYKVKAVHANETINIPENGKFIASYAGEYEIIYTFTDNISTYEYSYKVNATPSTTAVAFVNVGDISINKYIIIGQTYFFKDVKATTFGTGVPVTTDSDVYLVYYNANKELLGVTTQSKIANKCKIDGVLEGAKYVAVRYQKDEAFIDTEMAELVDVEYETELKMSKYFVGDFTVQEYALNDDGTPTLNDNGTPKRNSDVKYISNVSEGTNTLSFVNPIYIKSFSLSFEIEKEEANFDGIELKFTDVNDPTKVLIIKIIKEGTDYYSYIYNSEDEGGSDHQTWLKGFIFSGKKVAITYEHFFRRLNISGIKQILDFSEFGKCNFDLTLLGIKGQSSIIIDEFCFQGFRGNRYTDTAAPVGVLEESLGQFDLGEIVEIQAPEFFDILDQVDYSTYSLSIYHTEGKPVYDENGNQISLITDINKSVKVRVSDYGRYFVKTNIKDMKGNLFEKSYYFEGVDLVAPVITLGNNYNENTVVRVKAGQKVTFSYSVSDNVTPTDKIAILIQLYELDYRYNVVAEQGDDFIYIRHRGTFEVRICAEDETGNFSVKTYTLISE